MYCQIEIQVNILGNEKKNDNLIRKFFKDFLVYLPGIVIPLFVNMFALIIYTRVFPAEEYGVYSLIITNINVVVGVLTQWIAQSTMRYRPEYIKSKHKHKMFNRYLTLLLLLSNLFLFIVSIPMYFIIADPTYKSLIWIAVIVIVLEGLYSVLSVILKSDLRAKDFRFYNISLALFKFLLSLVFIYFIHKDISSLFYSNAIILFIISVSILSKIRINSIKSYLIMFNPETIRNEVSEFLAFVKSFWKYGIPMLGWFLGVSVLGLTDRYMLEIIRGSTELGVFSANNTLAKSATSVIASPIISAAQPLLMRLPSRDTEGLKKIENTLKHFTELFLLAMICPLVFVLTFHHEVGSVLLGEEFREGTIVIPILLVGLLLWHLALIGHKGYEIKEKTNVMLRYFVICILTNVALNIWLIPLYGYVGAAISTLVCYTLYPLLIFINSKNYIKWNISFINVIKTIMIVSLSYISIDQIKRTIAEDMNVFAILSLGIVISVITPIVLLILTEMASSRTLSLKKVYKIIVDKIKIG
jgi:O-antigen/teichoic acid export membrane protein